MGKVAYLFPGQGSQYVGMAKALYERYPEAKQRFEQANEILGFRITDIMFNGPMERLTETAVTQPAIFLHSVILAELLGVSDKADMVAGHSLGEFSALTAAKALSFEDGLRLVQIRAKAMDDACRAHPSTMAAIIGLDFETIEAVCKEIPGVCVPANYNAPGQLVISGSVESVEMAMQRLKERGAKLVKRLAVHGAFHSPLMEDARKALAKAIEATTFHKPVCPVYQNTTAQPTTDPETIKKELIKQLTAPVKWVQTLQNMIQDGAETFYELGPGKVLCGLLKRLDRKKVCTSMEVPQ